MSHAMCVQCAMGAMTAGVAATGLRSWLALRSPAWLTPGRMRAMSAATLAAGVLAAGVAL